jgi:hypothetical protein
MFSNYFKITLIVSAELKADIKIIEKDEERCKYLFYLSSSGSLQQSA